MSVIRVGIVGCGVIAPTHVEAFRMHPDVRVVWACDLIRERAQKLAEKYDIDRTTTDYEMVTGGDEVDLVSICTDHASHAAIAISALTAGKHVLCEKALAPNIESLDKMLEAERKHPNLVFSGVFQHRFEPINRTLRHLIASGALGQMLTAGVQMRCLRTREYYQADRWRGTWAEEGGSVLINQAIHYIDLLRWIMGGVSSVFGRHANLTHGEAIETEDTAVAALTFTNGALGTLEATCSSHIQWEPSLAFHGTLGAIELRHDRPIKVSFEDEAKAELVRNELDASREKPAPAAGKAYYGTGHAGQIADVLDAVREHRAPFVTALSAAQTVATVLGLYRSHHENRPVFLDVLPD